MRALAILALTTVAAAAQPVPGRYCASGYPDVTVGPGPGELGIDLADCEGAIYASGRVTARRCVGMGGAAFPYEVDLEIRPDGTLLHDGAVYARRAAGLCP